MSDLPDWFVMLERRLDKQDRTLERIEQKATETNSRVTQVEVKQASMEAVDLNRSRFFKQIWLACSGSAALGVLIVTLLNLH